MSIDEYIEYRYGLVLLCQLENASYSKGRTLYFAILHQAYIFLIYFLKSYNYYEKLHFKIQSRKLFLMRWVLNANIKMDWIKSRLEVVFLMHHNNTF